MMKEPYTIKEQIEHLDRIEATGRARHGDPQLNLMDIASITRVAERFQVTETMAYLRAKSLGLLSYQSEKPASVSTGEAA